MNPILTDGHTAVYVLGLLTGSAGQKSGIP